MKTKILLTILLAGLFWQGKGQEYIPMLGETNAWTYSAWPWDFVQTITTEDSLYNSKNYKKVLHEMGNSTSYNGLLREDVVTQQVWYIEPDSLKERIIYDFSLEEGDSVYLQYNADAMGFMLNDGWYFVDSIRSKDFFGTERRVFYLDNPLNEDLHSFGSDRPYIQWTEGVGSNLHPVYFTINDCAADFCGIQFVYGASVICSFGDDIQIYQDQCFFAPYIYDWTCFTPAGIENINNENLFIIYPNPVYSNFTLKVQPFLFNSVATLHDINGKVYKQFLVANSEEVVDISYLPCGIYFTSITKNNKIIQTKKIIITN